MEEDFHWNQKLVCKTLRALKAIKSREEEILTDENEIMKRWREYYENLCSTDEINNSHAEEIKVKNPERKGRKMQ